VKFATRPNRDTPRRPTSPADEHAKRAWAMFTPPSIPHRKSYPLENQLRDAALIPYRGLVASSTLC
jgi:hypothetical protein